MVLRFILRRVAAAVLVALAATTIVFAIAHLVPGDPVQAQLGDRAAANPEVVAAFRARWGVDKPVPEQYLIFLQGLTRGDLGLAIATRRPVLDDLVQYVPATFELATFAALIAIAIGIPLGALAAVKRDTWIDHAARAVSLVGVSAPTFWLAFIALALLYGGLRIAPSPGRLDPTALASPRVTGMYLVDSLLAGDLATFGSSLAHILLPAAVLAASSLGIITRTTRASMLETFGEDYMRTARAKGLREVTVIVRHALRNALIPVVTLGGLMYAQLLSGAVMTETIFSWPGLGRYSFQAALALDVPAITGVTLVVSLVYLLINLVVDISYVVLDPRAARQ